MKLFKYVSFKITVEPEALLLKPFKIIWNRDRSINKEKALSELGFIYFFCDAKSDYQYITNEEERLLAIKEGEGLGIDWKPDKSILEGMAFYNQFKSTAALLLEDTRCAVDKLRVLLRDIDLNLTDDKGKPVYTLNIVTSTIKQIPILIRDLEEAERSMGKEVLDYSKMRGQGEKTLTEDGY